MIKLKIIFISELVISPMLFHANFTLTTGDVLEGDQRTKRSTFSPTPPPPTHPQKKEKTPTKT